MTTQTLNKSNQEQSVSSDVDTKRSTSSPLSSSAAGAGAVPGIRPIALVGHRYHCPVHGHEGSVIVTGSSTCKVHGRPVARIGDKTSCGAIITTGSKNAHIDGNRPIARLGDKGICPEYGVEGEIVEGLDHWTLE